MLIVAIVTAYMIFFARKCSFAYANAARPDTNKLTSMDGTTIHIVFRNQTKMLLRSEVNTSSYASQLDLSGHQENTFTFLSCREVDTMMKNGTTTSTSPNTSNMYATILKINPEIYRSELNKIKEILKTVDWNSLDYVI